MEFKLNGAKSLRFIYFKKGICSRAARPNLLFGIDRKRPWISRPNSPDISRSITRAYAPLLPKTRQPRAFPGTSGSTRPWQLIDTLNSRRPAILSEADDQQETLSGVRLILHLAPAVTPNKHNLSCEADEYIPGRTSGEAGG